MDFETIKLLMDVVKGAQEQNLNYVRDAAIDELRAAEVEAKKVVEAARAREAQAAQLERTKVIEAKPAPATRVVADGDDEEEE